MKKHLASLVALLFSAGVFAAEPPVAPVTDQATPQASTQAMKPVKKVKKHAAKKAKKAKSASAMSR